MNEDVEACVIYGIVDKMGWNGSRVRKVHQEVTSGVHRSLEAEVPSVTVQDGLCGTRLYFGLIDHSTLAIYIRRGPVAEIAGLRQTYANMVVATVSIADPRIFTRKFIRSALDEAIGNAASRRWLRQLSAVSE